MTGSPSLSSSTNIYHPGRIHHPIVVFLSIFYIVKLKRLIDKFTPALISDGFSATLEHKKARYQRAFYYNFGGSDYRSTVAQALNPNTLYAGHQPIIPVTNGTRPISPHGYSISVKGPTKDNATTTAPTRTLNNRSIPHTFAMTHLVMLTFEDGAHYMPLRTGSQ
jgi:hypothetical protein